ncbi:MULTISPECIES: DNA topoisomerase III [Burkholderia]|jgi:DNA topoisomerase-3|uniref:DNA topoisomerase n=2 Tax=Burkholderia multivorans TaxID=87883 RepID=A0A8E2S1T1_9BURK|nr:MULTISPECIES: DNA topoisomerase III [Burkholderia]AJY19023.1 DNA topoisomerase III family protein [Burkholderia multivorans ATCC BAA-247]AOJ94306.1 DNA topoisomerase III [Burkholderia multivorans]AVR20546.1 DNA topoisomerase III [Burkholderia multivorans]EED98030.1 DNA topoisomerase III [Burkholderia multivorans CGD1]EEE04925.1 DNA topoisomerase III subfamily [Burkholderia multivorans CGD2]
MSKALIIAEKPSVANDIARALGGFTKHDEYFESDEYVLSSAVGHLLEIAAPEEYEVKRGKWSFAHLPVIPPHFDLNPIAKSESRLKVLTKLMKRKDVDRLINACDAGREGELIFRLIVQHAKAKQPVQRLWLQSMTPQAIRDGFAHLRSDADMQPLADAARCRSEADWLVGINGTRAMTAFNSKGGGFFLTTVGRVQTPTLSIVVEREEKIRRFVPRDYWEVKAEFACAAGFYEGKWFDPKFKRDEFDPEKRDSRLWSLPAAETIVAACRDQVGTVSEESKPSTQLSPLLFDLTSLQREANSRFGFSAKNTLGLAQALYEKHKVLTYPRTDARALPEDYIGTVKSTLEMLKESHNYLPHAKQVLDKGWVKPNKRIFDNSKISDHFAIIPTLQAPKSLSEPEQKLYDMVVKRFLAVFFPAAEYRVTTRITEVAGHHFKTEGKVLVEPGWLQVYGRDAEGADANLVQVQKDEKVKTDEIAAVALVTKPPARYSEATLLSAMEGAGKLVEDDELREAMAAKGLGTPATRAAIIEGLLGEKYLVREGRELIPTAKAFQLMTLLRGLGVKELTAPELTGEWEYKLSQMERGNLGRDAFMQEIARMTQQIVKRAKEYDSDTIPGDYATLETPCPNCGGQVKENYRRFACTKCDFSISKIPGSRQFEIAEVEELLQKKEIGPLSGFRSKMGRPFSAILKLTFDDEIKNYKLEFDFGQDQGGDEGEAPDFSAQEPVGTCPKCKGRVFEHGMSYVCEHSVANPKTCDFRSGKVILQQEITREQMAKLLADGRTDLLPNFKSSRTGRNFKAYLVKQPDGKIGFEFEKKEPKAAAAKKTAKSATKDAETVTEGADEKPAPARKTAARKTTTRKTGS